MSRTVLIDCAPRRPSDGVVVPVRLVFKSVARANFLGAQWHPAVDEVPAFEASLGFDGRSFGAAPSPQIGELVFALTDGTRHAGSLVWANAAVTIKMAPWTATGGDPADGDFVTISTGLAEGISTRPGQAQIRLLDNGQAMRVPALAAKFGSTGDALLDGADALKDRAADVRVPRAWGRLLSIPGLLVDRANGVWLFVGNAATSVQAFYDGGAAFTLGTARASLAALQANVPAAGTVDYCLDAGGKFLARPWTPPTYPFTAAATFGSTTAADIASAIVTGRTAVTFAAGTVAAFNALQGAEHGLYLDDETSVAAALDRLFAGLGAWWRLSSAGTITLGRWGWSAPTLTVAKHRRQAPNRLRIIPPTRRRSLGYARNDRVHSESEIARILLAGDLVYADGTTIEALKPAGVGATAGDNLIGNADLLADATGWTLQTGWTRGATPSSPTSFGLFIGTTAAAAIANNGAYLPIPPSRRLFVAAQVYRNTAATGYLAGIIYYRDASGAPIGTPSSLAFSGTTVDVWQQVKGAFTPPVGAATWLFQVEAGQTAGAAIIGAVRVAATQAAADVTGESIAAGAPWSGVINDGNAPANNATRNVFRGIYNSGTSYVIGDEVSNAGTDRLYFAVAASTGQALTNTAFWSLKLVTGGGAAGDNAVNVRLSNPLIMVPTAPDGSGGTYSSLTCQIEVYDGVTRKDTLGVCTFAAVGSPSYASVGATSGLITISDWGATSASPQFDATYAGVTYRVTLQLLRSLQGAAGPALTMAGGGAITYVDGALTPGGQSRTLTITRQGIVGTAVWTTTPGGITLTGTGDSRNLAAADMGSNKQVTIRATVGSVFDEDIVIRIDASTAEAGATAGDNLIANAGLLTDSSGWILQTGWTRNATGSGAPAPFGLAIGTTAAAAIANNGAYLPLTSRQLFVSAQVYRNTAASGYLAGVINWRDSTGAAISSSSLAFSGSTVDVWQLVSGVLVAPSNAASWLFQIEAAQAAGASIIQAVRVSPTQLNADVTATNVPALSVPPSTTVNFDYTGTVVPGDLPRTLRAIRTKGGVDVSPTTTWSLTATGLSASINSAGEITITACPSGGEIEVISNRDGVELRGIVAVFRNIGAPPSGGFGGGTSASDSTLDSVSSASYGGAIAGPMTLKAGSGGQISLYADLGLIVSTAAAAGSFGAYLKWQWQIVGGSYADAGSEAGETTPCVITNEGGGFYTREDGAISCNQSVTGLTPGADYEVQLLARTSSGTRARSFIGTATAVGS